MCIHTHTCACARQSACQSAGSKPRVQARAHTHTCTEDARRPCGDGALYSDAAAMAVVVVRAQAKDEAREQDGEVVEIGSGATKKG